MYFKPLDTIVPSSTPMAEGRAIQESITVRPRVGTRSTREVGRNKVSLFSGQVASHSNFALLAGQDLEPATLTDALNSKEGESWTAPWQSELSSLAQNNSWVI